MWLAGMAESKSTCSAFDFKDHSENSAKFDPFPINRLDADSECAAAAARALRPEGQALEAVALWGGKGACAF
jgi:hypothetical protein